MLSMKVWDIMLCPFIKCQFSFYPLKQGGLWLCQLIYVLSICRFLLQPC